MFVSGQWMNIWEYYELQASTYQHSCDIKLIKMSILNISRDNSHNFMEKSWAEVNTKVWFFAPEAVSITFQNFFEIHNYDPWDKEQLQM